MLGLKLNYVSKMRYWYLWIREYYTYAGHNNSNQVYTHWQKLSDFFARVKILS